MTRPARLTTVCAALFGMGLACSPGVPAPAELDPKNDTCTVCRMAVSDRHVAAQVVERGEEPQFFDDLGCLAKFLDEHRRLRPGRARDRIAAALGRRVTAAHRRDARQPGRAIRTGVLLGIQGTTAFGPASLALLRFTGGTTRASLLIVAGVILWIVGTALLAARRLERADI